WSWRGEMVGVGGIAVANDFTIDPGSSGPGVVELFQNQHTGAFAHNKAVPLRVERTGCLFRIIIPRAHGLHGAKATNSQRNDGRFCAAGEHDLRITHLERTPGLAYSVAGRGAS